MTSRKTTDFGYQQIPVSEKTEKVSQVFHSVAQKYDVMNDLMSGGIHRLWKRTAIERAGLKANQVVLDLAAGTGDLTARIADVIGRDGLVISSDINDSMLKIGREKLENRGLINNIQYSIANAECLPFPDNSFDCVTIGFGLRNVTDKLTALKEMHRVLKPSGRAVILEFSHPTMPGIKPLYDAYSFSLLPLLGKIIAGDADSYRYLAESIRRHPDQATLKQMMQQAGFENCDYQNLSGGIVAIHRGFKISSSVKVSTNPQ
jgi:demethylmenaquinone methyltransferase/2-methoxy-6-polyprenyl-1,4-benzoquinol methylase